MESVTQKKWTNTTEEEFLQAVKEVGDRLAVKMAFGFHTPEDVRQMVAVLALEALPKYNPEKGTLGGFLFRHCSNRLFNIRRNETGWRTDIPCQTCLVAALGQGPGHEDGSVCKEFTAWWSRLQAKQAVNQMLGLRFLTDDYQQPQIDDEAAASAEFNELHELIDTALPAELRADYLRLCGGVKLPRSRKKAVQAAVAAILRETGFG